VDFDDAQKNIITNTAFRDTNTLWSGPFSPSSCDTNNDFSIILEKKPSNQQLYLKPNTTAAHTITSRTLVSQNASSKIYKVEGNFSAIYLDGTTEVPVSGNYRTEIEVLN
jgi:hypothetical protein